MDLRIAGAEALGKLGDPAATSALARLVSEGGRPGSAAMDSLEKLLGRRPISADAKSICAALLVEDEELAARVARLTRVDRIPCDARPLLARTQASSPAGRAALAAVGELGVEPSSLPAVTKHLSELLRFGPVATRPLAARVVGQLALKELQPVLERDLHRRCGPARRSPFAGSSLPLGNPRRRSPSSRRKLRKWGPCRAKQGSHW